MPKSYYKIVSWPASDADRNAAFEGQPNDPRKSLDATQCILPSNDPSDYTHDQILTILSGQDWQKNL